MPRLSDSMEEGTILNWLVAEGEAVSEGQPLVEVETDKATVVHEAQQAGVILALQVREGASVPVGAPIAVLGQPGEDLPTGPSPEQLEAAAAPAPVAAPPPSGSPVAGGEPRRLGPDSSPAATGASGATAPGIANAPRAKASPVARRLAAAQGVDLSAIEGSGPGGRVILADVERAAAANGGREPDAAGTAVDQGSSRGVATRHDLTRTQATIARRMAQSRATVPDIELQVEVNMTRVVDMRDQLVDLADPAPSLNDFVIKAAGLALREFPRVNGAYRDAAFEMYSRVNVGLAVAGENTLVVPTIFDADQKSLAEIAATSRSLAAKVRDGSILPSELAGATFTVSNLGMYGIDSFTAVINQPQSAILAVGAVRPRPVVEEPSGTISAAPTMTVTLACDHRILYGVDGARFLTRVRGLLERPVSLLT